MTNEPPAGDFVAACRDFVIPVLATHDFELVSEFCEGPVAWVELGSGNRYIHFGVSMDIRDRPWYVGVRFGTGHTKKSVVHWDSAAYLGQFVEALSDQSSKHRYDIQSPGDIRSVLERAVSDVTTYASSFLAGDLTLFRKLAADTRKIKAWPAYSTRPVGRGD